MSCYPEISYFYTTYVLVSLPRAILYRYHVISCLVTTCVLVSLPCGFFSHYHIVSCLVLVSLDILINEVSGMNSQEDRYRNTSKKAEFKTLCDENYSSNWLLNICFSCWWPVYIGYEHNNRTQSFVEKTSHLILIYNW